MTLLCTLTAVVGPTLASTCWAACWGVSGAVCGTGSLLCAGTENLVTVFAALCHSQAVLPSRITSVSVSEPGMASRKCWALAYQTFTVCDPVSSEVGEVALLPPVSGRLGRPRQAG